MSNSSHTGSIMTRCQWRPAIKSGDEVYWKGSSNDGDGAGIYRVKGVHVDQNGVLEVRLADADGNEVDGYGSELRRVDPEDRESQSVPGP